MAWEHLRRSIIGEGELFLDLEGWQDSGSEKGGRLIKHIAQCLACRRHPVNAGCTQ